MDKKQAETLLNAMKKCYFASAMVSDLDHLLIGVAAVSFAYGAGLPIPGEFKGFEQERKILASVLTRATEVAS